MMHVYGSVIIKSHPLSLVWESQQSMCDSSTCVMAAHQMLGEKLNGANHR